MSTITASGGARVGARDRTGVDDRRLLAAATLFTVAVLLHGADHLRRGIGSLSRQVFWLGTAGTFVEVAIVVLVCARHRWASLAAATGGFTLAAGYVLVHFLPSRRLFSDSFVSAAHVSPLSWAAAALEVATAAALGLAGLTALRHRGGLVSAAIPTAGDGDVREGLHHPLALAMIAGSVLLLVISFVQL